VKSYLPLATVVGPGKTTSFSPMIADIVKRFFKVFGEDIVVLFDFKRQKLGFVRESKSVLENLASKCSLVPSSFVMDQWSPYDYFYKLDPVVALGPISSESEGYYFNESNTNFGGIAIKFLGSPISCVDEAYCYPTSKRFKKTYTKESKPKGVSIVGVLLKEGSNLFLEADVGKRVVKFTISNTGQLTHDQFYKLNRTNEVIDDDVVLKDDVCPAVIDDDQGVFKIVKRKKKKKKKIYLLKKTNTGLYLKNFKFNQPTKQHKSNSFKYVNTNRFSVLENIIDNVSNVGSGSGVELVNSAVDDEEELADVEDLKNSDAGNN